MTMKPVDTIILAGSRPGADALADAHDAPIKSLVKVAGKPMLARVAKTLIDHEAIGSIRILTQDIAVLQDDSGIKLLFDESGVEFAKSRTTIAASIDQEVAHDGTQFPVLITTADNVLLNAAMIDHFLGEAAGADIAIAVVEKRVLLASYPASKRTWLKFRGGQYSGANLFYFGSAKAREILRYWAQVEQDRKKGWKILGIFGPWLLFLVLTRQISADQLAGRVGKKLGLDIRIIEMPQAEACIDVDKEADLILVEQILAASAISS